MGWACILWLVSKPFTRTLPVPYCVRHQGQHTSQTKLFEVEGHYKTHNHDKPKLSPALPPMKKGFQLDLSPITPDSIAAKHLAKCHQERTRPAKFLHSIIDLKTGEVLKELLWHPKSKQNWNIWVMTKFGCLDQGTHGRVEGTNTKYFMRKADIPEDWFKYVTYIILVCVVCTEKKEPNRTQL